MSRAALSAPLFLFCLMAATVSGNPKTSDDQPAAARSRQQWQALLAELDQAAPGSEDEQRLREQVDAAAGQRFGYASRLFWHTNWDAAIAEAKRQQKPMLSLRMLGRLTDELSCANSRYFRTALYPNAAVSKLLQDHFVLHWSSERPVPVLTVDFGDGRVMKRTVTGNSIHYLVTPDGNVVDALPGMVSPQTFAKWLAASQVRHEAGWEKHRPRRLLNELSMAWALELSKIGRQAGPPPLTLGPNLSPATLVSNALAASQQGQQVQVPRAEAAVTLARPKHAAEAPLVAHLTVSGLPVQSVKGEELWQQLAKLYVDEWRLDAASVELIRSLRPVAATAGDETLESMIREFEFNVAQDDIRNRFMLQWQVRRWILQGQTEFESLNRRVYTELFLTPREDPYLGLVDAKIFTGLVQSGLSE